MEINFWAATDSGRVREHNEDCFLVNRRLNLFMVCDGMGGHAAGEVASETATRTVHEILAENHTILARYAQTADVALRKDVLTLLEFAVRQACSTIYEMAQDNAKQRGMGTTLSLLLVCGRRGFVAHVGDSRIYLLRKDQPHQLTEDHTVHNELKKRGRLTDEEVAEMPFKNAVTRAVGIYETVDVDTLDFDILPGDRFLLCSDGLHGYFGGNNLATLLGSPKLESIPGHCIDFANRKGGNDNITVVVVAMSEEEEDRRAQEVRRKLEVLRGLDIFQFLTYKELTRVMSITQHRQLSPGDALIEADQADEAMYIVLEGAVSVHKGHTRVGRLDVGQAFNLFALIEVHPAATRYVAESASTLLRMPRDSFYELMRSDTTLAVKLLWNMLQVLGRRSAEYLPELELDARSFSDISGIWNIQHLAEEGADDEEDEASTLSMPALTSGSSLGPEDAPEELLSADIVTDDAIQLSPDDLEDLIEEPEPYVLDSGDFEIIDDPDVIDDDEPTGTHRRPDFDATDFDPPDTASVTKTRLPRRRADADTLNDEADFEKTRLHQRPPRAESAAPSPSQESFARLRSMIERKSAQQRSRNLGKFRKPKPGGRFRNVDNDKTQIHRPLHNDTDTEPGS